MPEFQRADFRGSHLAFRTFGKDSAPWLVVTHGMALDSMSFRLLAERLANSWRILLWDMPGHGMSGPMPATLDMAGCVDALEAVLEAAGVKHAVLLGFSFGGVVSQLFAHRAPARVDGLIAYGCLSPLLLGPQAWWVARLAEWLVTRGEWESVRWRFARLCSAEPEIQRSVHESMTVLGPDGFRRMTRALLRANQHDPAFRISGPVMWIQGERDSNGPSLTRVEAALRSKHPVMTSVILPGAGHCAHQEQPEAFEAEVTGFLNRSFARG